MSTDHHSSRRARSDILALLASGEWTAVGDYTGTRAYVALVSEGRIEERQTGAPRVGRYAVPRRNEARLVPARGAS